jgi:hypothetical protein
VWRGCTARSLLGEVQLILHDAKERSVEGVLGLVDQLLIVQRVGLRQLWVKPVAHPNTSRPLECDDHVAAEVDLGGFQIHLLHGGGFVLSGHLVADGEHEPALLRAIHDASSLAAARLLYDIIIKLKVYKVNYSARLTRVEARVPFIKSEINSSARLVIRGIASLSVAENFPRTKSASLI